MKKNQIALLSCAATLLFLAAHAFLADKSAANGKSLANSEHTLTAVVQPGEAANPERTQSE